MAIMWPATGRGTLEVRTLLLDYSIVNDEYGFLGDRLHFNCCSVGVPPISVQKVCANFYGEYMQLVYGELANGFEPLRSRARGKLARLINCAADEIAFTNSTAMGLSILASGFPLGPGDNIVIADLENAACMIPWANAGKNRGFELRVAKTARGEVQPDDLFRLADRNTKIIVLSAAQYGTGFFADLKELGAECRRRGIVFAIDAIQAIGRMKIDVTEMNIDYLTCGGFKALGAGFGIGFIFCAKHLVDRVTPSCAGANSVSELTYAPEVFGPKPPVLLHNDSRRLEAGSHNTLGIFLLDAAVELTLVLGIENIQQHILDLEKILRDKIDNPCLNMDVQRKPQNWSGIVTARYPKEKFSSVKDLLNKQKIILTANPGYIRLAIHCYNTEAQILTLAGVLNKV